jgi:hypothetical protein
MKIVLNEKLVKRNKVMTQVTFFGALAVLVMGFIIMMQSGTYLSMMLAVVALFAGYILSRINIRLTNQWNRSPRPDEAVTAALKGLGEKYTLYHYSSPASHMLVGQSGVWVILPFDQDGKISYVKEKDKWVFTQNGSFFHRLFTPETIGDPNKELAEELKRLNKWLKEIELPNIPEPRTLLVFLHDKTVLDAQGYSNAAMKVDKIKDYLRKQVITRPEQLTALTQIQDILGE